MYDRRTILLNAWARYHRAYGTYQQFFRFAFRQALKLEWQAARFAVEKAEAQARRDREAAERKASQPVRFMGEVIERPMSEMEARIDALKYLPFRYNIAEMAAEIHAEYAARAA